MEYQEIMKFFGTPLEEIAKPKTLNQIKLSHFFGGVVFGAVIMGIASVWLLKNKRSVVDHFFGQGNQSRDVERAS